MMTNSTYQRRLVSTVKESSFSRKGKLNFFLSIQTRICTNLLEICTLSARVVWPQIVIIEIILEIIIT